jgi:hypothetical protein
VLQPGTYKLEAESKGFSRNTVEIVVSVNQDIRRDVTLEVAAGNSRPGDCSLNMVCSNSLHLHTAQ